MGTVLRNWLVCHAVKHGMLPVHWSCGHKLCCVRRPELFLKVILPQTYPSLFSLFFFLFSIFFPFFPFSPFFPFIFFLIFFLLRQFSTVLFILILKFFTSVWVALTDLQDHYIYVAVAEQQSGGNIYVLRKSRRERCPKYATTAYILFCCLSAYKE